MAEIYKEIVFLNSKHKETAEGAVVWQDMKLV